MDAVNLMGWIGIAAGAVTLLVGAYALCGKLLWLAQWKWGDRKAMRRSVVLGWNTGEMPEGEWLLIREHADGAAFRSGRVGREYQWALMIRRGDRCHSANGGFSTPITNVTGWLRTVEDTSADKDPTP